ncbi:MAG: DUF86 domain-containing protein [Dehalococcoidia bacterium]|nr:DUF86 domain-containing protein [Dehalococcoidia bacterium]
MRDAGRDALAFIGGKTVLDLESEPTLAPALVQRLEVIGEAASHVTEATRAEIPLIPWSQVVGIRHRLVHAYYDIQLGIVWSTVVVDLPPMVEALEAFLQRGEA